MQSESSLPCSQKRAIGHYTEPGAPSPRRRWEDNIKMSQTASQDVDWIPLVQDRGCSELLWILG
jgi:hypothetical protein